MELKEVKLENIDKYLGKRLEFEIRNLKRKVLLDDLVRITDIPKNVLRELLESKFIVLDELFKDDKFNTEMIGVLKGIALSVHSNTILSRSFKRMNKTRRDKFIENIDKPVYQSWIETRVYNLKDEGKTINYKQIYYKAMHYFPVLKKRGDYGLVLVKKIVYNAKNKWYKKQQKENK